MGAVLGFSLVHISNEVDDFQRVPVPGKARMQLAARKYIVYYEDSTADETVPSFEIAITDVQTGLHWPSRPTVGH